MASPQGLIIYPGVQQIISGSFTLSHGISPSTAHVEIAPQSIQIPVNGTMELTYGQQFRLQFSSCRVSNPSITRGTDGRILSFGIQDRRWKWAYGEVYGRYNLKKADGTVDTLRSEEKTPQELATILLKAMGEYGVSVAALPNDLRPEFFWEGNNPAEELASLCDLLGCRVGLGIDDKAHIWKLGEGLSLPDNPLRRTSGYGISITGMPDAVKVVCGPTLFQSKLKLEAVGLDVDGRIKIVDRLSYKPSGGWETEYPDGFWGITNRADRRLALRTVWRWFRVVSQADGSMTPLGLPEDFEVVSIQQLLPLRNKQLIEDLDRQRDPNDLLTKHPLPAIIEGSFMKRDFAYGYSPDFSDIQKSASTDSKGNTFIGARYVGGFSLDEERGIVELSDWCVRLSASDGYEAPELYLTCSYEVKTEQLIPYRHGFEKRISRVKQGTGPKIVPASDIQRMLVTQYGPDGKKGKLTFDNSKVVEKWAQQLADSAAREYQSPETEEVEYAGWIKIAPDGKIQQIGWTFGQQGAVTRASSNTEFDLVVPPYKQLREAQKIRQIQGLIYREPVVVGTK